MPPHARLDAPEVVVKEALRLGWTPPNVPGDGGGITPYVVHGWLGDGADGHESNYTVTVSNPQENPVGGGQTGYSGMAGDGSGPVQRFSGTVTVNTWAKAGWTGLNGNSANPRKTAHYLKREVERILFENNDGQIPDGQGGEQDTSLDYLGSQGSTRFVEDAEDPEAAPMYRYQVTAGYGYHVDPA